MIERPDSARGRLSMRDSDAAAVGHEKPLRPGLVRYRRRSRHHGRQSWRLSGCLCLERLFNKVYEVKVSEPRFSPFT
jgi:hypothetical protein